MIGRLHPRQQQGSTTITGSPTSSRPPIALTTIFTPPSSCLDTVTYDGTTLWQGGIRQNGDAACYPSSFRSIIYSGFSPGICPHLWTSAGALSHSTGYQAMCCPSDYILSTTTARIFLANFCFSLMTTPLTNVVYVPSLTNGPAPASAKPSTLRQTDVSSTTVFADVIQVQWQSTDQQIIALMRQTASSSGSRSITSSSPSISPGLSTTSPSAAAVSTTADAAATAAPSSGLATGAKIGIGVGVPLGVIALAGLAALVFLFRRRRKPSKPVEDEPAQDVKDPNLAAPAYQELPLHERQPPAEMDASSTAEVPGSTVAAELPPHDHSHDSSPPGNPGGYLSPEKITPQGSPGFQRMSTEKYARRPSQG